MSWRRALDPGPKACERPELRPALSAPSHDDATRAGGDSASRSILNLDLAPRSSDVASPPAASVFTLRISEFGLGLGPRPPALPLLLEPHARLARSRVPTRHPCTSLRETPLTACLLFRTRQAYATRVDRPASCAGCDPSTSLRLPSPGLSRWGLW